MKRDIFRILLTTLLTISCVLIKAVNYSKRDYNLNGDIYYIGVKEYSFVFEFGELKRGTLLNETDTYFLQNGNVYIDSLYNLKLYKRYNYDNHNNVTEEMRITVASNKRKIGDHVFNFNDTTEYYLYKYDYDANGQIKEINKFDRNKSKIQKIVFTRTATEEKIEYWGKHNIQKEEIICGTSKTTNYYSSFNDYKTPISIINEVLNRKGNPIKEIVKTGGGLQKSETIFTYDENGNVINESYKVRNFLGQGEDVLITRDYKYDKNGNWVRKLEYKNGELVSWKERVIGYASSPNDYTKIIDNNKKLNERNLYMLNLYKHYSDSIQLKEKEEAARKKQIEDSLAEREQLYKEMDEIIERELLQKHITASYEYNTAAFNMKLYGFDNKIRDCMLNGTTIAFIEKKGTPCFIANMPEYRVCRYRWDWDASHETDQIIGILYSPDLSELLLYIPGAKKKGASYYPMIVALHKKGGTYISYEIEKDALDKLEKEVSPYNKTQMNNISTQYLRWNGKIDKKL